MVLLGTSFVDSAYGLIRGAAKRGFQLQALNILSLQSIFFNLCRACQASGMSCIPPSAFTSRHIRETQQDHGAGSKHDSKGRGADKGKFFNITYMELTPLKYNSKLMNSIWGFYNRYSPHNVKKINDAFTFNVGCQQPAGNSTN